MSLPIPIDERSNLIPSLLVLRLAVTAFLKGTAYATIGGAPLVFECPLAATEVLDFAGVDATTTALAAVFLTAAAFSSSRWHSLRVWLPLALLSGSACKSGRS